MNKKVIAVNQASILSNKDKGTKLPVISVYDAEATGLVWEDGFEAIIYGQDGKEAARVIYSPDNPWRNRAHVWIEAENKVDLNKNSRNFHKRDK